LPLGVILHIIYWIFVLKGERHSRVLAFPPQGGGLPETFYPNPIAEWATWLLVLGIGSVMASLMAGFSVYDGFMSSEFTWVIYIILGITVVVGVPAAYFTGKRLLTVRVDPGGIAYARGRGDLQWMTPVGAISASSRRSPAPIAGTQRIGLKSSSTTAGRNSRSRNRSSATRPCATFC
jgi:hypothetical protein